MTDEELVVHTAEIEPGAVKERSNAGGRYCSRWPGLPVLQGHPHFGKIDGKRSWITPYMVKIDTNHGLVAHYSGRFDAIGDHGEGEPPHEQFVLVYGQIAKTGAARNFGIPEIF